MAYSIQNINIFLNPLFIFGYGFIPAFGISGLAIATLISQFIGLIYLANKVYSCKLKKYLYLECFKPKLDYITTLFKQSVPIMFTMLMIMFGVALYQPKAEGPGVLFSARRAGSRPQV